MHLQPIPLELLIVTVYDEVPTGKGSSTRPKSVMSRTSTGTRYSSTPGTAPKQDAKTGYALTFTYLLRYVEDREATLRELVRVVRPGGRVGMVEFGVPYRAALRALWRVHTRVGLPLLGRAVSSSWREVGAFLGPNIEQFHAAEPDLPGLWRRTGIGDVRLKTMSFGAGLVMWGTRNDDSPA